MIPAPGSLSNMVASLPIAFGTFRQLVLCAALSSLLQLSACRSSTQAKDLHPVDSSIIQLPKPVAINKAEYQRLNQACQYWFDTVLKNSSFNGGMLVTKNGNIVFETYKGTAHLGQQDSINAGTVFHIASVSKTFTAMAVLKLWEQGRLNIDSSYQHYFSAFNYPGVTVRSLLNHRSGLPNYLYFMDELGWDKSKFITNRDVLDTLIVRKADIKNIGAANARFNYCNTNYALLALLVEKISGQSFPHFMDSCFFKPLQMFHTFIYTPADSNRITPSYDWRGVEITTGFLDQVYGDKNVYSNVRDLSTWDRALSKTNILSAASLQQAYSPYSNERPGVKNYGLGWRMNVYGAGKKVIFHNGWWHGNNAVFIRLIPEDATIIVTGNRYSNAIYKAKQLINIFNDYQVEDETEE